jgi:aminoglycoside 2'-N-acetyltransferase I
MSGVREADDVRAAATADLAPDELAAIRSLLDRAFDGDFADTDFSHCRGGLHLLVVDDGRPVAHASVVPRRLSADGRFWRTGYVEAVAVDPAHRGRGHAAAVMHRAERHIVEAYELGALSAADGVEGFYQARGWQAWRGHTAVRGPVGTLRTPEDDGGVFVLPVSGLVAPDPTGTLACDWRDGDVW